MSHTVGNLRQLDQCLDNRQDLNDLRVILDKIERCCVAVERRLNLADVLHDPSNYQSLMRLLGPEGMGVGFQLIQKMALSDYPSISFTLKKDVEGMKKVQYLFRLLGGWTQFDIVLCFLNTGNGEVLTLNPQNRKHWERLIRIPHETLVTGYVRTCMGKANLVQEKLALERLKAAFELVQNENVDELEVPSQPKSAHSLVPRNVPRVSAQKKSSVGGKLSLSFEIVVNKMDTFIHAGNAQLIVGHLGSYSGRVEMFVMRGQKFPVQLDPDSIWGVEIRNGERVVYDFYGTTPSEEYIKELASKTNKYTQMDKVANE